MSNIKNIFIIEWFLLNRHIIHGQINRTWHPTIWALIKSTPEQKIQPELSVKFGVEIFWQSYIFYQQKHSDHLTLHNVLWIHFVEVAVYRSSLKSLTKQRKFHFLKTEILRYHVLNSPFMVWHSTYPQLGWNFLWFSWECVLKYFAGL